MGLFFFQVTEAMNHPTEGKTPFSPEALTSSCGCSHPGSSQHTGVEERESMVGRYGTAHHAANAQADKGVKSSCSRISWSHTADKQMANSGLPGYSKYRHKSLA